MEKRTRRPQTLGEEIGNSVTHGVMALFAIASLVLLLLKSTSVREYAGAIIYSFCMFMLYIMSCLYHSFKNGSTVKKVFRVFDHTSIFLLIGGTYAPILLNTIHELNPLLANIFFGIQWGLIVIGIVCKTLIKQKTTILHTVVCAILGWSGLLLIPLLYQYNPTFFYLILGGGLAYTIGVIFFASRFKYAHFVWHFFCIAGTLLHFIGIYLYVF